MARPRNIFVIGTFDHDAAANIQGASQTEKKSIEPSDTPVYPSTLADTSASCDISMISFIYIYLSSKVEYAPTLPE